MPVIPGKVTGPALAFPEGQNEVPHSQLPIQTPPSSSGYEAYLILRRVTLALDIH